MPTASRRDLAARLLAGDVRALARAIRLVEERAPGAQDLLVAARPRSGAAHVVGITGPPGAGKSTLCDLIVGRWRQQGHTVGVVAVDPSSPFSGGAILGDRVRMQSHALDPGVFIRSMAARGHLGGLSLATREAVQLLAASGRDRCLIETVGVGQSELDVMRTADTTVVVTTPASGDAVQIIKAGILEIADIFVVNKSDLPAAPKVAKELREMVHLSMGAISARQPPDWTPPVLLTNAASGDHVPELVEAIDLHRQQLEQSGLLRTRRAQRLRAQVEEIAAERALVRIRTALRSATMELDPSVDPNSVDPYDLADRILATTTSIQGAEH